MVLAAVAAIHLGLRLRLGGSRTGFGGTIAGDGYAQFFKVLFAATLALAALLSVRHVDAEHVRPAEFYALLLMASTGMMLAASAPISCPLPGAGADDAVLVHPGWDHA